jgi:hypothetical protein
MTRVFDAPRQLVFDAHTRVAESYERLEKLLQA